MRKCFFVSFATAAAYFLTLVLCIVYSSSNNRVRTRHLLLQSYIQLRQSLGSLSQRYRAKNYTDIHESQNISVRPENKNYSYHNAASNYSSTHPKKRSSSSRSYRMWKQIFGKTGTKTKRRWWDDFFNWSDYISIIQRWGQNRIKLYKILKKDTWSALFWKWTV